MASLLLIFAIMGLVICVKFLPSLCLYEPVAQCFRMPFQVSFTYLFHDFTFFSGFNPSSPLPSMQPFPVANPSSTPTPQHLESNYLLIAQLSMAALVVSVIMDMLLYF